MELLIGLFTFVGNVCAAWAMSAWSYFHDKIGPH